MKTAVQVIVVLALSAGALCKAADLKWQEGKITQVMEESNVRIYDRLAAAYDKGVTYTIQSGEYTYTATEVAGFVTSKFAPRRADENDTIKFALKGNGVLFMQSKDGKEHRMLLRSSIKRKP